uniref:NADH-ubiquinone oxidoreductase chain 5 n=1 Tax=Cynoglossus puncticeps TaxID=435148 RepID=V9INQ4_9PLEU|nr:NADH dehydrogenase subunit 5 [Cynoglossus puncticeps]AFB71283.1 NADH dehydrogenase subunit 5 [Cynoglossus puncticeps]WOV66953.1 NADH dehydrogenase subunit 5 [Cynoglossus puncticeps]
MLTQFDYAAELMVSCFITIMLALMIMTLGFPLITQDVKMNKAILIMNTVKLAFIWSLLPLCVFLASEMECITNTWKWFHISSFTIYISIKIDYYTIIFIPVALYVTWSILQFALWYMEKDPNIDQFFKYLLTFLISMIILVTANNLFQLFIGWEGVGIMSFLLISWWFARPDANTAALQAVLYNRAGDLGLFIVMAWMMTSSNSWELDDIFLHLTPENATIPAFALILAAAGKSAQFGLHPWLPSAMEGPTPVSALLHSSTMVVAGIFLLIRMYPVIEQSQEALTACLCLGAITTLFTAGCALTQNDIKKIIAFSTSSQLGLMMVTIGLAQPQLAFLHICTHAFFKAMLFICSGVIIHSLNNEQDIRKMGGMFYLAPMTASCITLGSLALTGTPFLSGFYSKDAIIEALNTSNINAWALALTLLATSLTAVYSLRIVYYVLGSQPQFNPLPPINENDANLNAALMRLAIGSLIFGQLITSTLPPQTTPTLTMSLTTKTTAILITLMGLGVGYMLSLANSTQIKPLPNIRPHFTTLLGFFPTIVHRSIPTMTLSMGQLMSYQLIDQIWLKLMGPEALSKSSLTMSKYINTLQQGVIKLHLMTFLLAIASAIVIFTLAH